MEGVLALVRLYQRFTFTLNDQKHGGRPLEHESMITLMPKVQHKHASPSHSNNNCDNGDDNNNKLSNTLQCKQSHPSGLFSSSSSLMLLSDQLHGLSESFSHTLHCSLNSHELRIIKVVYILHTHSPLPNELTRAAHSYKYYTLPCNG